MSVPQPPQKVDRQTTTPFLLKLFYKSNSFHRLDEFTPTSTPNAHLQIYTWPTCTLRELTHLLTSALPSLLPDPAVGTRIAFRLVFPDTRSQASPGRFLAKDLGSVVVGASAAAAQPGDSHDAPAPAPAAALQGDALRSLQDVRFVIGDYVACAICPPGRDGEVAPLPPSAGRAAVRGGGYMGALPPAARGGGGAFGGPRERERERENGYADAGFRVRGGGRGWYASGDYGRGPPGEGVPPGEWRRGERIPDGPGGYRGRGRGRGW